MGEATNQPGRPDKERTQVSPPSTEPAKLVPGSIEDLIANARVYDGDLLPQAAVRRIQVQGPDGGNMKKTARYDWLKKGCILRVSGPPALNSRGELSMTVDIQYKPSKTLRLTATSQHVKPLIELLRHKVGPDAELKEPLIISAAMEEMRKGTRGYNVVELYLEGADGTRKTIIGPEEGVINASADEGSPLQAFM